MRIRGPRSWPVRLLLVLLAGNLLVAAGFAMIHLTTARVPGKVILYAGRWTVAVAVIAWFAYSTAKTLREKPTGSPELGGFHWQVAGILGVGASWTFLFLTTQGNVTPIGFNSAHVNIHGWAPSIESFALAEGLLYALLYMPEIIRRKLPFERASQQILRLVPAALAVAAAIITGSYVLALHFMNEPLARIPPGPLIASIVAVMALLTPLYQLIARATWRYGLADILDPRAWRDKWSKTIREIRSFPKPGEHLLTDLLVWHSSAFGEPVDSLLKEIARLDGWRDLGHSPCREQLLDLYNGEANDAEIATLVEPLTQLRDHLKAATGRTGQRAWGIG
jgi:hypothetical protein